MTRARDAADNIGTLATLPQQLTNILNAVLLRGAAGDFTPVFTAATIALGPIGSQPQITLGGTDFKNLTLAFTVPAPAKGDTGPAPVLQVRNVATGNAGTAVSFQFVVNPAGGYFVDVTIPRGAAGSGTGDVLAANNGSEFTDKVQFRQNVGLAIGSAVQAYDVDLDAIAALTTTAFGRDFLVLANAAAARTKLGLATPSTWAEATALEVAAGTASRLLSAAIYWSARQPTVLTDAPTIALDLNTGINFTATITNNRVLGAPTNGKPGQRGFIRVVQDGTGGRTLSFSTAYSFLDLTTAPSLNAAANAVTILYYEVSATGEVFVSGGKPVKSGLRRVTVTEYDGQYYVGNHYTAVGNENITIRSYFAVVGVQVNTLANPGTWTTLQSLNSGQSLTTDIADGVTVRLVPQNRDQSVPTAWLTIIQNS